MFKLVVLSALVAAAAAEPGLLLASRPYAYSPLLAAPYVAPAVATAYAAPLAPLAPAGFAYNAGYAHFIKKRSAPVFASPFLAPSAYFARPGYVAPLAAGYSYSTPLVSSALTYSTPVTHLIKKRSVALAPLATSYASTYIAPTAYATGAPLYSSAYASPYYTAPFAYSSPFFIKK